MNDVSAILDRKKQADTIRLANSGIWRDIAPYVHPFKREIGHDSSATTGILNITSHSALFDSSGIEGNETYGAGCMSWMTPSENPWFAFDAPQYLAGDDTVESWYSKCSDITAQILAGSNFYSEIHNVYLDDGAFGTSGLFIEEDFKFGVRFETLPIGDYSILENHYGEVDTLFQSSEFTPRQAAQKWGEDNLPTDIRKALGDEKKKDDKREFIRAILPRESRDTRLVDQKNMPWAVVWIEPRSKQIVSEEGFMEAPFAIHRHAKWTQSPYGLSPGMRALYDMRQINVMQQYLDTLVEQTVTPPVIAPAGYEGVIDLRGGGITYEDGSGSPKFWEKSPSNYSVGEDRTLFRRRQIDRAFHVELFQALASVPVGKEMTAAEVRMRQSDRLTLFSPTFARKNKELNGPIIRRVFAILLRMGAFPQPPRQLIQETEAGPFIPDPEIVYTSRLALQMRQIHNDAAIDTMTAVQAMAQTNPEILDNFNFDEMSRGYARNLGLPEKNIRPELERDDMRRARAEQQAQIEEEVSQIEEAEAVSKLAPALQKAG